MSTNTHEAELLKHLEMLRDCRVIRPDKLQAVLLTVLSAVVGLLKERA